MTEPIAEAPIPQDPARQDASPQEVSSHDAQDARGQDVRGQGQGDEATRQAEVASRGRRARSALRVINWGGWILALGLGALLGALLASSPPSSPKPGAGGHEGHDHGEQGQVWTCSMDPQVRSAEPGLCPICGMDLVAASSLSDLGPAQVKLDDRARALAQLRVEEVVVQGRQPATGDPDEAAAGRDARRWLARLTPDERQERTITAWTAGRVERLRVATTGQRVWRGQVVLELYSPEVYAAHRDLLSALMQVAKLEGAEALVRRGAQAALDSARQRLRLLGVNDQELARMEASDKPWTSVPQRAPFGGTVIARQVSAGQYVQAGTPLLKIADLSRVWAEIDAYEADLPTLRVGMQATLRLSALPGQELTGPIVFIDPTVDPRARTAKLRVELDNSQGLLKPGMTGYATLHALTPEAVSDQEPELLTISRSAPLFTGRRWVVYVELTQGGQPLYEAREVILGPRTGERYPVLAGLKRGERVVTHGAFVLDADLQLRGGLSMMRRPDDRAWAGPEPLKGLPAPFMRGFSQVVSGYLDAQEALAEGQAPQAQQAAERMIQAIEALAPEAAGSQTLASSLWRQAQPRLAREARELRQAKTLEAARAQFKFVTAHLKPLLAGFGNPLPEPIRLAYCPMAFDNQGGEWFQRLDKVDNVYFGDEMRRCGEVRESLPYGEHLLLERAAGQGGQP